MVKNSLNFYWSFIFILPLILTNCGGGGGGGGSTASSKSNEISISSENTDTSDSEEESSSIEAGEAAKLTLDGAPYDIEADRCQGPYSVYTRDINENDSSVSKDTEVHLEGGTHVHFYEDATCNGEIITSVTVLTGERTARFYLKSSVSEAALIEASAQDFQGKILSLYVTDQSSSSVSSQDGPSKLLLLVVSPLRVGACSTPVLFFEDSSGNSVITDPLRASFDFKDANGGEIYSDPNCRVEKSEGFDIEKGQKSYQFFFKEIG